MTDPATGKNAALKERAQRVVSALKDLHSTIVTAESCTAGALAAILAQAEGANDVLHGGFIAYTKAHKTNALGVSARLLEEQGAVNAEVAQQMAAGALTRSAASIAVAITGVLGPEEDEDGNPVGLIYFCVLARGKPPDVVKEEYGKQPRERLLERGLAVALEVIEGSVLHARKHA